MFKTTLKRDSQCRRKKAAEAEKRRGRKTLGGSEKGKMKMGKSFLRAKPLKK